MNISNIPPQLRERDQWVVWKLVKGQKVCFQVNGSPAKSNDPLTWATFDAAVKADAAGGWEGIGFMFSHYDPFVGVDLDGCRNPETGETTQWAKEILNAFDSYAELSPSATGFKIFCEGSNPSNTGKNKKLDVASVCDKSPGIEIYNHTRWFAVTGKRAAGKPAACRPCQGEISKLWSRYFAETPRPVPALPLGASFDEYVVNAASRYVAKMEPAVSGSGGHNRLYAVACVLLGKFALERSVAHGIIVNEYNPLCQPPWSDREIEHKLNDAEKVERGEFRERLAAKWEARQKRPQPGRESKAIAKAEPMARTPELPTSVTLKDATSKHYDGLLNGHGELVDFGVGDLDYSLGGGVAMGEIMLVGARPSHGKTAFAHQLLQQLSYGEDGQNCLFVSEEMSAVAIGKRSIQYLCDVPEERWRTSQNAVREQIDNHFEDRKPVYIVEGCGTAERAAMVIEHYVQEKDVKYVAIDYLQNLRGYGKGRYEQITDASQTITKVCRRTGAIIIVLAQFSREIEGRNKFQPKMSDFKESGQLEQDADVVLGLVWPHRLDSNKPASEYRIYVMKNRNRAINQPVVNIEFKPSRQMFLQPPVAKIDAFSEYDKGTY